MRARISRRLLHSLAFVILAVGMAWTPPAHGKGGFCPGLCGETSVGDTTFDSVTYE